MDDLIKKTNQALRVHSMVDKGDAVIVGVSGGADSVCLLLALSELADEWELNLTVAHLDHSTRGGESARDAEFVVSLAKTLGLEYITEKRDVPRETLESRSSFQETARKVRSDFLESTRSKLKADKIAVGHILDDQVETVLINFLRGSGTRGLGGMRPVRGNFIRPLFYSTRDEIIAFLKRRGVDFREDASNAKPDYLRNRIRLDLIPLLSQDYNPNIQQNIFETSRILQWDEEFLDQLSRDEFGKIGGREAEDQKIFLEISRLTALPQALKSRLVREAYRVGKGDLRKLSFFHVQQVLALLEHSQPGKKVSLPDDWLATVRGEKLCFQKISEPKSSILNLTETDRDSGWLLTVPGETVLDGVGMILNTRLEPSGPEMIQTVTSQGACLDWEKTGSQLRVRFFRPGDRFHPLGMAGSKKLKDFLIDVKIPREQRKSLPLLTSAAGDIIWVYGVRISEDYKVTSETQSVLIIEGLVGSR